AVKSASTSVSEAIFTVLSPLHRRVVGFLFSRRWPGFALLDARDQRRKAHGNGSLARSATPTLPQKALAAARASDCEFHPPVRNLIALQSPRGLASDTSHR